MTLLVLGSPYIQELPTDGVKRSALVSALFLKSSGTRTCRKVRLVWADAGYTAGKPAAWAAALKMTTKTGPSPVDRARTGSAAPPRQNAHTTATSCDTRGWFTGR
jgi:hypothetical protein